MTGKNQTVPNQAVAQLDAGVATACSVDVLQKIRQTRENITLVVNADMPSLLEYQSLRSNLIQEDRSLRREFSRIRSRTELEVHADAIVRKIRAEEANSIWTVESESVQHPFPGMEFLTGRSIIEKTRLFEILGKVIHSQRSPASANFQY
ncbi:hypothetical protein BD779DRAFT_1513855 [Infundibulicybe gibba]|nr:hypothetical protein BD779DRAFT_1513855 [Infundibulicybe gibba]